MAESTIFPGAFPTNEAGLASAAELADFVFQSFYFAQGDVSLQNTLIAYGQSYYHQDIVGQPNLQKNVQEIVQQRCGNWVRGSHTRTNTSPAQVEEETINEVSQLFGAVYVPTQRPVDIWMDNDVVHHTVARDYRWLVADTGRPNRKPDRNDEYNDPFLSFLIHYGVLRNTTHRPIYDAIFERVGAAALYMYSRNNQRRIGTGPHTSDVYPNVLRAVVQAHCTHHPQQTLLVQAILDKHAPKP